MDKKKFILDYYFRRKQFVMGNTNYHARKTGESVGGRNRGILVT